MGESALPLRHRGGAVAAGRHLVAALGGFATAYLAGMSVLVVVVIAPLAAGWRPHVVATGSMQPALHPGDVVLVAPAGRSYRKGQVITFRESSGTVTHRIVDVGAAPGGPAYTTKGDANRVPDSRLVQHTEVIGAVRLVVPLIGRPLTWVRRQQWLPVGIWLVTVLVALSLREADRVIHRPGRASGRVAALER